jgi:hypothetical protein
MVTLAELVGLVLVVTTVILVGIVPIYAVTQIKNTDHSE